jgi:5-methylcytosine-specific restriction endonuclease McrA
MNAIPKQKPFRSKKYLKWVKTLPCCICGLDGCDPHHAIGMKLGGMGTKAPDDMVMPLCRKCHSDMHNKPQLWYLQKGFIIGTKKKADLWGISYEAP